MTLGLFLQTLSLKSAWRKNPFSAVSGKSSLVSSLPDSENNTDSPLPVLVGKLEVYVLPTPQT